MEKLVGHLNNVIFESKENNYQIISFYDETTNKDYVICGYFQTLIKELRYEVEGTITNHPKHGEQVLVSSVKKLLDNTEEGIVEYLSSNFFPGVGVKYAKEVYDKIGSNCLELILESKDILDTTNLPTKIKDILYTNLIQNKSLEELFVKMFNSGLSSKMLMKLYEKHQDKTLSYIYNDPYNLIYVLDGFGFKKADSLAIKLGFELLDYKRIEALLLYTIHSLSDSFGMSYVTKDIMYNQSCKNGFNNDMIPLEIYEKCLNNLIAKNKIVVEDSRVYLRSVHDAEVEFANTILNMKECTVTYKEEFLIEMLKSYEYSNSIEFSSDQVAAIKNSLLNKVSVITGGPGTGKTTIIKAIIEIYSFLNSYSILDDKAQRDIKLLAPTGKAAKRLREKCNFTAETIHRALGYDFEGNFIFHEENKLISKLIIIDEVSMVDLVLINNLFKALNKNTTVIFIGDHNQLPSILCGDVLNDIINSNVVKVSKLATIYRQKNNSGIIELAKMVNEGNICPDVFHNNQDLHFIPCKDNDINNLIVRYINKAIELEYDLHDDITVLAPMYKGVSGIDTINDLISSQFNTDYDFEFEYKDKKFKQNDKIIQLVNSKEKQIYNGDIGIIDDEVLVEVDGITKEKYRVLFDNINLKFSASDFENVKLAYATSIHKSQGSEYKVVIIPITKAHTIMLKRKLLYTGITRAKEKLILIGDYNVFINAISRVEDKRFSSLVNRLTNNTKVDIIPINDPDIPFDTLGECNMENITPYSFM